MGVCVLQGSPLRPSSILLRVTPGGCKHEMPTRPALFTRHYKLLHEFAVCLPVGSTGGLNIWNTPLCPCLEAHRTLGDL